MSGDQVFHVPQMFLKPVEKAISSQLTSSGESISGPDQRKDTWSSLGLSKSSLSTGGSGALMLPGRESEREGSPNPQRKFAASQLNPTERSGALGDLQGTGSHDGLPVKVTAGGEEVPLQEWRVPPVVISSTSSEEDSQKSGGKVRAESPTKRSQRSKASPKRKTSPKKANRTGYKNPGEDNSKKSDSVLSIESGCSSDNDNLASSPQIRQRKTRRKNFGGSNSSSCSNSPKTQRGVSGLGKEENSLRTPSPAMVKGHSNPLLWEPNVQANNAPRMGNGTQNGSHASLPTVHIDSTADNTQSNNDYRVWQTFRLSTHNTCLILILFKRKLRQCGFNL